MWYSFLASQSLPTGTVRICYECASSDVGSGLWHTALGTVVFVAEVLAQERDVDDGAPWQVGVVGGGCEGDGIVVGPGALLVGNDVRCGEVGGGFARLLYLLPWAPRRDWYLARSQTRCRTLEASCRASRRR